MSLRRILWSLLAGVSIGIAGCDDEEPPKDAETEEEAVQVEYGVPVDASVDGDVPPDEPPGEELPVVMYGVPYDA